MRVSKKIIGATKNKNNALRISQFQLRPAPPGLLQGICPPCQSRGWGICKVCAARGPGICNPAAIPEPLTRTRFPIITKQRILLLKKADWLICQGREKIEEGCKGMFLILSMHFFIAYQARIT